MKGEDFPRTVELLSTLKIWLLDRDKINAPGSECYMLQCMVGRCQNELFEEKVVDGMFGLWKEEVAK